MAPSCPATRPTKLRPGGGGKGFPGDGGAGGSYTGAFGGGIYLSQNASLASDIIQKNTARAGFYGARHAFQRRHRRGRRRRRRGRHRRGRRPLCGRRHRHGHQLLYRTESSSWYAAEAIQQVLSRAPRVWAVPARGAAWTSKAARSRFPNRKSRTIPPQGGNGGGVLNSAGSVIIGFATAAGGAAGGGIYVGGGTVNLTTDVIQYNQANAGFAADGKDPQSNNASGGGLYAVTGTTVTQDAFTTADLLNNTDSNNDGNNNSGSGGPI